MRTIWGMMAVAGGVVVTLLAVVGLGWIIDLAPLLIFFSVAVAYGILSSRVASSRRDTRDSQKKTAKI